MLFTAVIMCQKISYISLFENISDIINANLMQNLQTDERKIAKMGEMQKSRLRINSPTLTFVTSV